MVGAAGGSTGAGGRLRALVRGSDDPRVRAIWRTALAWPVLWFAAGSIAVAAAGAVVPAALSRPYTMLAFGLFQGAFFAAAWVAWARYFDRRPLANYGFDWSRSWLGDLVAGFVAVAAGFGVWLSIGSALGWASLTVSLSAPGASSAVGAVAVLVAVLVNVWVQETVFIGVTVTNAAEGLASRGLTPTRAVLAAWAVAVVIFAVKHRPATVARTLNLLLALGVFGLVYVHTGELALSVGMHTGVNYAGQALFVPAAVAAGRPAVFTVTNSLTGLAGSLNGGAIPQLLVAYLLLLGWLRARRGEVSIDVGLARWCGG